MIVQTATIFLQLRDILTAKVAHTLSLPLFFFVLSRTYVSLSIIQIRVPMILHTKGRVNPLHCCKTQPTTKTIELEVTQVQVWS